MPRTARFDTSTLLDAAVGLAAEHGPAGVTMSAVARAVGAPSGSVYHRFSGQPALLAELWLHTVGSFQEGFLAALRTEPPAQAPLDAALHILEWARNHPREARILLYGPADFAEPQWPEEAVRQLAAGNRRVAEAISTLARRMGGDSPQDRERLAFFAIDLPYAIIRRHVITTKKIPPHADDILRQCAPVLLGWAAR